MALNADDGAAGKAGLRLGRAAAFRQCGLEGVDIGLGRRGRAEGDIMQTVLAAPGRAGRVGRGVPERRLRLLQRPHGDRHVLVFVVFAGVAQRVAGQPGAEASERVDEDVARVVVLDLVKLQLIGRDPTADADVEPAAAQMIEHADFLDQPQRRIERQQIDDRPQPHALGRARDRGEIDARRRHQIERRLVVLGDVQAIECRRRRPRRRIPGARRTASPKAARRARRDRRFRFSLRFAHP